MHSVALLFEVLYHRDDLVEAVGAILVFPIAHLRLLVPQGDHNASAALSDGSSATGESTARVKFIDSFFPDTYCTFEKILIQRFFYLFIFNISCSISQIFNEDLEW